MRGRQIQGGFGIGDVQRLPGRLRLSGSQHCRGSLQAGAHIIELDHHHAGTNVIERYELAFFELSDGLCMCLRACLRVV